MNTQLLRILDANYNRAKEAMRVSEDILRFVAGDADLTYQWKRARHDLTSAVMKLPLSYRKLIASRNSRGDVGKNSLMKDSRRKLFWSDLLIANAKRSQEALRVMEELSKLIHVQNSKPFQSLRFRIYELEKKSLRKL